MDVNLAILLTEKSCSNIYYLGTLGTESLWFQTVVTRHDYFELFLGSRDYPSLFPHLATWRLYVELAATTREYHVFLKSLRGESDVKTRCFHCQKTKEHEIRRKVKYSYTTPDLLPNMRPAVFRTAIRPIPRATAPLAARSLLIRPFSSTLPALKKNKGQNIKSAKQKLRVTEDDQAGAADDEGAGQVVVEEVVSKARAKMEKSVHWAKAVLFEGVERGRGRVSPGT